MLPRYEFGTAVRVTRNVRNDGTYPGMEIGQMLIRRGTVGYVQNVGTFLQDQLIYSVHFVEDNRVIGCREEELIDAADPWHPSKYEFREKVTCNRMLAVKGDVIASPGDCGEIVKVLDDSGGEYQYHVRFPGHTLQVAESMLDPVSDSEQAEAS